MTGDRTNAFWMLRLSAVNVLLADPEAISDGLEEELYKLREQLVQQ